MKLRVAKFEHTVWSEDGFVQQAYYIIQRKCWYGKWKIAVHRGSFPNLERAKAEAQAYLTGLHEPILKHTWLIN